MQPDLKSLIARLSSPDALLTSEEIGGSKSSLVGRGYLMRADPMPCWPIDDGDICEVPIDYERDGTPYYYAPGGCGKHVLDREDVLRWKLDPAGVAREVAKALGCQDEPSERLGVWSLGTAGIAIARRSGRNVYFVERLDDEELLQRIAGADKACILIAMHVREKPKDKHTFALADAFRFDGDFALEPVGSCFDANFATPASHGNTAVREEREERLDGLARFLMTLCLNTWNDKDAWDRDLKKYSSFNKIGEPLGIPNGKVSRILGSKAELDEKYQYVTYWYSAFIHVAVRSKLIDFLERYGAEAAGKLTPKDLYYKIKDAYCAQSMNARR